MSIRSKLTAPLFDRLARIPCPTASLASSGSNFLRSAFAASCSWNAGLVRRYTAANSAQELEALISTTRTASKRGRGGSTPNRRGVSPFCTQRQNFFGCDQKMLVQRIGVDGNFDPFAAAGDDRQHCGPVRN